MFIQFGGPSFSYLSHVLPRGTIETVNPKELFSALSSNTYLLSYFKTRSQIFLKIMKKRKKIQKNPKQTCSKEDQQEHGNV